MSTSRNDVHVVTGLATLATMISRPPVRALLLSGGLAAVAVLAIGACTASDTTPSGAAVSSGPGASNATSPDDTAAADTSATTDSTTSTSTSSTTTTTTIPLVTEGGIVKVANASNFGGAAGLLSAALIERGFTLREPTNGAGWEQVIETTKIYSRDESRPVAESIARLLGGVKIERMPTPVPITDAMDGLGDANVLVMLGMDLAGSPLPGDTAP